MVVSSMFLLVVLSAVALAATGQVATPRPSDAEVVSAACGRHTGALLELLVRGGNPNACDCNGTSALMFAACQDDVTSLSLLLKAGANLVAVDDAGEDALSYAVHKGALNTARNLLAFGASPDFPAATLAVGTPSTRTRLTSAAFGAAPEAMTRLLLESGADPRAAAPDGRTALHASAAACKGGLVSMLIAGGADPNARNAKGESPLGIALSRPGDKAEQCEETTLALLNAGADPNQVCGGTLQFPLTAALGGHLWAAAEQMLSCGAEIDAADTEGTMALMTLAGTGNRVAVAFLLEHGADPTRLDRRGRDAADVAAKHHDWDGYVSTLTRAWTWPAPVGRFAGPTRKPCGLPLRRVPFYDLLSNRALLPQRLTEVDPALAEYIDATVRRELDPDALRLLVNDEYRGGASVADWVRKGSVGVFPVEATRGSHRSLLLVSFGLLQHRSFLQVLRMSESGPTALALQLPDDGERDRLPWSPSAVLDLDCDGQLEFVTADVEPHSREEDERAYTTVYAWRVRNERLESVQLPESFDKEGPALVRRNVYSRWRLAEWQPR